MKKILSSGATLEITRAPFSVSHRLFKTVMRELSQVEINVGAKGKDIQDLFKLEVGDQLVNTLKNVAVTLLSSEEIEAVLWVCFDRALYNNQKVTKEIFDEESAAGDYLEIAKEVMIYNMAPFTKSLQSVYQGLRAEKISGTQK